MYRGKVFRFCKVFDRDTSATTLAMQTQQLQVSVGKWIATTTTTKKTVLVHTSLLTPIGVCMHA